MLVLIVLAVMAALAFSLAALRLIAALAVGLAPFGAVAVGLAPLIALVPGALCIVTAFSFPFGMVLIVSNGDL